MRVRDQRELQVDAELEQLRRQVHELVILLRVVALVAGGNFLSRLVELLTP